MEDQESLFGSQKEAEDAYLQILQLSIMSSVSLSVAQGYIRGWIIAIGERIKSLKDAGKEVPKELITEYQMAKFMMDSNLEFTDGMMKAIYKTGLPVPFRIEQDKAKELIEKNTNTSIKDYRQFVALQGSKPEFAAFMDKVTLGKVL